MLIKLKFKYSKEAKLIAAKSFESFKAKGKIDFIVYCIM